MSIRSGFSGGDIGQRHRSGWGACSLAIGFACGAFGAVIDVPGDHAQIQAAIEAATQGDTVLVQPGTYVESLDFLGKGIRVQGSAPVDSLVVASTVVDAMATEEDHRSVVSFVSGEDSSSVLAGLTLIGGTGTLLSTGPWGGESTGGGGVYCAASSSPRLEFLQVRDNLVFGENGLGAGLYCGASSAPAIKECSIFANTADRWGEGGGIYCAASSPTIQDCTIHGNSAFRYGGGICCDDSAPLISHCTIARNQAGRGSGIYFSRSAPQIEHCSIVENEGGWGGGGICIGRGSTGRISNCTIAGNLLGREGDGGGIACGDASTLIAHCLIINNEGGLEGGGFSFAESKARVINCVIVGNHAGSGGGVFSFGAGGAERIINCTFSENSASQGGGLYAKYQTRPQFVNSILWENTPDEIKISNSLPAFPQFNHCDIQGGHTGEGNIDGDPLFHSRFGFEFLLAPSSPCVDAGHPSVTDGISDWHPRWPGWYPNGPRSDMGAYGGPENAGWLH